MTESIYLSGLETVSDKDYYKFNRRLIKLSNLNEQVFYGSVDYSSDFFGVYRHGILAVNIVCPLIVGILTLVAYAPFIKEEKDLLDHKTTFLSVINTPSQDQLGGRIAYDFIWSDRTQIGMQYQGTFADPNVNGSTITVLDLLENEETHSFINNGNNDRNRNTHIANAHILTTLDTSGIELSVDADYFVYRQDHHPQWYPAFRK